VLFELPAGSAEFPVGRCGSDDAVGRQHPSDRIF
jgi:hypothetical protein